MPDLHGPEAALWGRPGERSPRSSPVRGSENLPRQMRKTSGSAGGFDSMGERQSQIPDQPEAFAAISRR